MTTKILLVEDSIPDVRLTQRAFRGFDVEFVVAQDGEEAILLAMREHPAIVLLDLNLPRIRGDEVLRRLKADRRTAAIPVVVLTSSDDARDVARVYKLQAATFVTKPATPSKFRELAEAFNAWWLRAALLPKGG